MVTPYYVSGYIMSSDAAHPQESWLWLRFLTYQYQSGRYALRYIPVRRSVTEEADYGEQWREEVLGAIRHAMEYAEVPPPNEPVVELRNAVAAIFAGQDVKEALAEAQVEATEALYPR